MAKLPLGRNVAERGTAVTPTNLEELARTATYIVDEAGRKQAIVVEWSVWQNFIRQAGGETSPTSAHTSSTNPPPAARKPSSTAPATDSEYALRKSRGDDALFRPKPASPKEAADFTLESSVIRRNS